MNTIRQNASFAEAVFGGTYEAFKRKKKEKPVETIRVICQSIANCNGSCGTIVDNNNVVIRCTGQCCEGGVFQVIGVMGTTVDWVDF